MFGSSEENGLDNASVQLLVDHYGKNVIPAPVEESYWKIFFTQFADLMVLILLITAIISAVVDWPRVDSAVVLGVVVVLNVAVGFWQEVRSSRTVAAMKSLHIPLACVKREGGTKLVIPAPDLVPGHIVLLGEGDFVPADLRLLKCNRLTVQESMLTGESVGVDKSVKPIRVSSRKLAISNCHGNVFMGTMVIRGTAVGIVVRTGVETEIGKISAALSSSPTTPVAQQDDMLGARSSPLKARLSRLAKVLVLVAVILCALVAVIGAIKGESIPEMIRLALSLAVSVIPEGFVAILTVAISLAIRRLAQRGALARRMNVVETLGAVSVVASDKTGTLTEGKMRLKGFWFPSASKFDENQKVLLTIPDLMNEQWQEALFACILCNNALIEGGGEPTEAAMLAGAISVGGSAIAMRRDNQRMVEIPFDSERRMMSVVVKENTEATTIGTMKLFSKGAIEAILPLSSHYQPANSDPLGQLIDETILNAIAKAVDHFAAGGLRVIALASKRNLSFDMIVQAVNAAEREAESFELLCKEIERDLTFIGLVCLDDPPRERVTESVALCRQAGIKVCMITGDHLRTATAIAAQIGIYDASDSERHRTLHGRDLDVLNADTLSSLRPFPSVFARVSPGNKLMIVKALQKRGEIVAMTGDGVNDAPAIRQVKQLK